MTRSTHQRTINKRGINWADPDERRRYHREYSRKWAEKNRDKMRTAGRAYDLRNREARKQAKLAHRHANIEERRKADRAWHAAHPDVARRSNKKWRASHIKERTAASARRYASKRCRTPRWANLNDIRDFYRNCPPGFHVDHIVPLHGDGVCGLHVLNNLQYLPALENLKKGNRFEL